MQIDVSALSSRERYRLMVQTIVPRPIAWVLSDNGDSTLNLAPFSYFTAVSSNPALLVIVAGKKAGGEPKDTLLNARERGHFVVHIAHGGQAPEVTESSRTLPHGDSELTRSGLETVQFDGFSLPRLAACRVALGCRLHQVVALEGVVQTLIFGRIERAFVDDAVVAATSGAPVPKIDALTLDPLARLGGDEYSTLGKVLSVPRPG